MTARPTCRTTVNRSSQPALPLSSPTRRLTGGLVHEAAVGNSCEWYTPPELFIALGASFDLDPCAPPSGPCGWMPVANYYTVADDGLAQPWTGRVWLNPPYGRSTRQWLQRLVDHGNGIGLFFARTDVRWFQDLARHADLACFVRGRVRFVAPDGAQPGPPGAGSVLLAYGTDCAEIVARSALGLCARFPARRDGRELRRAAS